VFVNKYSEGYPKGRYYGGNEVVDELEMLAQERAKKLFGVPFVNVQPYSGSPANLAVYLATCNPGDAVTGQALFAGGHLTHGHSVSATAIFYKSLQYGVIVKNATTKVNDLFDYEEIRSLVKKHKPKLIWVGGTAHPIQYHYEKFAKIADEVGAYLAADIAHIAGLIAGGAHPSPVPHVHIITTTTHKTLRGPRGAMIMITDKGITKDPDLPKKINKAVFPGLQGGPHDNTTAGIAVALYEAAQPEFRTYAKNVVKNAGVLAETLVTGGVNVVAGRSENHLLLVDLTSTHGIGAGIFAEKALDLVHLTLNKNTVPGEKSSPFYPSGIRLGTAAATSRGMNTSDMKFIAQIIIEVLEIIKAYKLPKEQKERKPYVKNAVRELSDNKTIKKLRDKVIKRVSGYPIP
jgi:glycine hydroxymethyltransferase